MLQKVRINYRCMLVLAKRTGYKLTRNELYGTIPVFGLVV